MLRLSKCLFNGGSKIINSNNNISGNIKKVATFTTSTSPSSLSFLSDTIVAESPKVGAKQIELSLKVDLLSQSTEANKLPDSFIQDFIKTIPSGKQNQQTFGKNNRLLTVIANGVEHKVNVDENVSIKTFTTPSVLYSCKLIDSPPQPSTSPSPQTKPIQYMAFDSDGNHLPNILLIKNLKFDRIIIKTKEYAIDTNSITVEQVLLKLCKEERIGKGLTEKELKKCIALYEQEIAITSPKTLFSLKTDPEVKYQIGNHFNHHVNNFIQDKMEEMEKDSINSINNENNNNNNNDIVTPSAIIDDKDEIEKVIASLSEPHKWYSQARKFKRNIILHVGPTNSGKTYRALNRLMESESGVYCGPLRLLAHEIYDKMNNNGIGCSLFTGQLRITNPNAQHSSCTIEMASTENMIEVAVIDEFQMISDVNRGPAWTRAILGIPAVELHLCGDNTAVELVRKMCDITGDTLTINSYDRLSGLTIDNNTTSIDKIQKGDCLITFKKKEVLKFKDHLEARGFKCAVVYGSLPPITRIQQSKLFNDGNDVDVLIATDAVGMGLNLNINRVVFSTTKKFDGHELRWLFASEIKQIAGRAGRYGTKYANGVVTCFDRQGLEKIRTEIATPNVISDRGGIFPSVDQVDAFSQLSSVRDLPFSIMMEQFLENTQLDKHYFLGNFETFIKIAKEIDDYQMLVKDKYQFVHCPIGSITNKYSLFYYKLYANLYSLGKKVPLTFNIDQIKSREKILLSSENNNKKGAEDTNAEFLSYLEEIYNVMDIYLWLSNHFPNHFIEPKLAIEYSEFITNKISEILKKIKKEKKSAKKEQYRSKR